MKNKIESCKKFWLSRKEYPFFGPKIRRFYELKYLIPQLEGESLLDLGCGDGTLIRYLMDMTNIKKFYGYDISPGLLKLVDRKVKTKIYDCYNPTKLPKTDITILAGVIQYILEDKNIHALFKRIKSNTVFIRSTCNVDFDSVISGYSKRLKANYVSRYRTLPQTLNLIMSHFKVQDVQRIYPDEIESTFGSKQYYIKAIL